MKTEVLLREKMQKESKSEPYEVIRWTMSRKQGFEEKCTGLRSLCLQIKDCLVNLYGNCWDILCWDSNQ